MAILTRVKWYLIVVLIYISLIISDVEHLFMCFFNHLHFFFKKYLCRAANFLTGASKVALVVKNLPDNAWGVSDVGSIPGLRRFPRGGNGNPFQYSCLENRMERGAWWATVHGAAKSQAQLSDLAQSTYTHFFFLIGFCLFVCLFVFVIELHEVLVYFGDELFVSSFICKYFLPFCVLSSHFVHGFLCPGKGTHLLCGFVSKKDL